MRRHGRTPDGKNCCRFMANRSKSVAVIRCGPGHPGWRGGGPPAERRPDETDSGAKIGECLHINITVFRDTGVFLSVRGFLRQPLRPPVRPPATHSGIPRPPSGPAGENTARRFPLFGPPSGNGPARSPGTSGTHAARKRRTANRRNHPVFRKIIDRTVGYPKNIHLLCIPKITGIRTSHFGRNRSM